jgi:methyltransferase family protein
MAEDLAYRASRAADPDAIARAHAVYTPLALAFYDVVVHGLSNRFAWRCPTKRLHGLYAANLSANHLEAGAGTGLFLDRAGIDFDRLVLLDINEHCLARAALRLARFKPALRQANLLAALEPISGGPFESVGLTYVLHCLPGALGDKLVVLDHLRPLMAEGAVLFGATILGRGVPVNAPARALLDIYNAKGVFDNREDDIETLTQGLEARFDTVEIDRHGCVALFRAS